MFKNRSLLIAIMLVVAVAVGTLAYSQLNSKTESRQTNIDEKVGRVRVINYSHSEPDDIRCLAMDPGCGLCTGKVIDKQCYVNQQELEELRKYSSDIEVEQP